MSVWDQYCLFCFVFSFSLPLKFWMYLKVTDFSLWDTFLGLVEEFVWQLLGDTRFLFQKLRALQTLVPFANENLAQACFEHLPNFAYGYSSSVGRCFIVSHGASMF